MSRLRIRLQETLGRSALRACAAAALCAGSCGAWAAPEARVDRPPPPPPSARTEAPVDLTGYWVSVITEDWRFRMIVPGRGEYDGIPLSLAGKRFADGWSPAADEAAGTQCKAYGAGALMRIPERLHIRWLDDDTLRVDTDAGMQTRLLRFKPSAADRGAAPSLQGLSLSQWVIHSNGFVDSDPALRGPGTQSPPPPAGSSPAVPAGPRYGWLKITTTDLSPGYLRKNGVPYGAGAKMTEYWEVHTAPDGSQWMIDSTELDDPVYLQSPYVFSPNFRREPDGSKWAPSPCSLRR